MKTIEILGAQIVPAHIVSFRKVSAAIKVQKPFGLEVVMSNYYGAQAYWFASELEREAKYQEILKS
jgi:hypothetical protein